MEAGTTRSRMAPTASLEADLHAGRQTYGIPWRTSSHRWRGKRTSGSECTRPSCGIDVHSTGQEAGGQRVGRREMGVPGWGGVGLGLGSIVIGQVHPGAVGHVPRVVELVRAE